MFLLSFILVVFLKSIACQNLYLSGDVGVLYDSEEILESHSIALGLLKSHFKKVDLLNFQKEAVKLTQFKEVVYSNVLLISTDLDSLREKSLSADLLNYVDLGGNLFYLSGESGGESSRLINLLGFYDTAKNSVIDHYSYNQVPGKNNSHTVVVVSPKSFCKSDAIFKKPTNPIIYEGRGFGIDRANPMTFTIVSGETTSYLADPLNEIKTFPLAIGSDIVLVGGVEMLNRARAVVVGSYRIFDNNNMLGTVYTKNSTDPSGNMDMFVNLFNWVFQRTGVVRVTNPVHVSALTGDTPDEYVVDNLLKYSITLETKDSEGNWVPFLVDDLQMELVRLSKFARVNYTHDVHGRYTVTFYAPDEIGTFGLRTRMRKVGYTYIDHQTKIIIRPRKHNDYQRFLLGAYPYYLTSFTMMGLVFVLVIALLNQSEKKTKTE